MEGGEGGRGGRKGLIKPRNGLTVHSNSWRYRLEGRGRWLQQPPHNFPLTSYALVHDVMHLAACRNYPGTQMVQNQHLERGRDRGRERKEGIDRRVLGGAPQWTLQRTHLVPSPTAYLP